MWSIQKILVPTDFGKASELAVEAAITLAKKFDAAIVLMHAYHLPVYPYPTSPNANLTPNDMVEYIERGATTELQTTAAKYGASGVPIATILRAGIPWEQILRTAKEINAGLIVIGSRGLRGLPRALLGSTAERVVRYSSVPVMAFHGPLPVSEEDKAAEGTRAANDLVDRWLI